MKPKLWNGANAVGEAKARMLDLLDVPYLAASGPGFVARKAGAFSSVTGGAPPEPENPPDGWYSSSDATAPPAQIVGTYSPQQRFRKRGTAELKSELVGQSLGLYASGAGWGYMHQVLKTENNWRYETVSRTKNGGRSAKELFSRWYLATPLEGGYVGYAGRNAPLYPGAPSLMMSSAAFVADGAVSRQRPIIDLAVIEREGTDILPLALPALSAGFDYSFAEFKALLPVALVLTYAKADGAPGTIAVTYDAAGSWTEYSMAALMPGYAPHYSGYKTEAQIAAERPDYTAAEVQAKHMGQTEVRRRWRAAHAGLYPISARRVLCVTEYYVSATDVVFTESVVDLLTGGVERQHTYAADYHGYATLGRDTWLRMRWDGETLAADVTADAGATYAVVGAPQWLGDLCAVVPAPGASESSFPRLYFTNAGAGTRTLYYTDDLFATYEEAARVSPKGVTCSEYDYSTVYRVGSPQEPAPIDAVFPWRVDARFTIPDWWKDGVSL